MSTVDGGGRHETVHHGGTVLERAQHSGGVGGGDSHHINGSTAERHMVTTSGGGYPAPLPPDLRPDSPPKMAEKLLKLFPAFEDCKTEAAQKEWLRCFAAMWHDRYNG